MEKLVDLMIRIDASLADHRASHRLWDPKRPRETSHTQNSAATHAAKALEGEPMQVGHTRISLTERQGRQENHLCLYCGGKGHVLSNCPLKDNALQ